MLYKRQDGNAFIKRYCDGILTDKAAFALGSCITIEFYIMEEYLSSRAFFYLGNDEMVLISRQLNSQRNENGYSIFSTTVDSKIITGENSNGLFFYHFEAETKNGRVYTCTDGVNCSLEKYFCNEWQMLIYNEEYNPPSWLDGGVIYQIFVDRFAIGEKIFKKADAVYNDYWDNGIPEFPEKQGDEFPNNTHFGGNLYGVAEKLDYLSELGITCIYLNPIFEAYSNHKYDTGDYLKVDEAFGGDIALEHLLKKASEKGISIILDGVFNHVGADSIYFNKFGKYSSVGAYQSKNSPFYAWFDFKDYPETYDCWWGVKNLPKIKRNGNYDKFICDEVIPKYMKMGIAGWRLDVVDEFSGNFTEQIIKSVKNHKRDSMIIGEVWEDATNKVAYDERKQYFLGRQLDSATNYPLRNALIEFALKADSSLLKLTLQTLYEHYPTHKLLHIMNIVGTHDTERILNVLGNSNQGDKSNAELSTLKLSEEVKNKAIQRLKNVYLLLAFMPGIPCIYYGDEVGLEGWHDPFNRRPFPWNNINNEIHDWFVKVNRIRLQEPLFKADKLRIYDSSNETFIAERYDEDASLLIISNIANIFINEKKIDIFKYDGYNYNADIPTESVRVYKKVDGKWILLI
ncbi:MAG: hypothetical protein A2Y15_06015 [Clostridiales bacterium GWF2_36_10]|nr:MAG: hypothetical protein A2Y15_06015 [Clostridiales bacterium GWF2_36_10]HAN20528.1 hypothetical protein [Clostridiales bacterium]